MTPMHGRHRLSSSRVGSNCFRQLAKVCGASVVSANVVSKHGSFDTVDSIGDRVQTTKIPRVQGGSKTSLQVFEDGVLSESRTREAWIYLAEFC